LTDAERDALFARLFATPDGHRLLEELRCRGAPEITLAEIEARLARARRRWTTGAPR
jgi:hypothetical protein